MSERIDVLVVGGGPAALATARAYRDAGGTGAVTLATAEPHLPYRRPPLTKELLRGETEPDDLPIEPPEWYAEHDVRVLRWARVTALHPGRRVVSAEGHGELAFEACVLATGSEPVRPRFPGADDPAAHVIREIDDSLALRAHGARAVVIGSGFIGCEATASLALRGADVTLVTMEAAPQAERLGTDVGERIAGWLRDHGVRLVLGAEIEAVRHNGGGWVVDVAGAEPVPADTLVLATGVRPRTELAEAAGLALDLGAVACDEHLATSAPGVYAAGDVACARNAGAGRRLRVEHWGEALNHGEVAGRVLAGEDAAWDAVPGFWSVIGGRTLKYAAWGDGWDEVRLVDHPGGGFTAWYGRDGATVGVLTHEADEDYERGSELVATGAPLP